MWGCLGENQLANISPRKNTRSSLPSPIGDLSGAVKCLPHTWTWTHSYNIIFLVLGAAKYTMGNIANNNWKWNANTSLCVTSDNKLCPEKESGKCVRTAKHSLWTLNWLFCCCCCCCLIPRTGEVKRLWLRMQQWAVDKSHPEGCTNDGVFK